MWSTSLGEDGRKRTSSRQPGKRYISGAWQSRGCTGTSRCRAWADCLSTCLPSYFAVNTSFLLILGTLFPPLLRLLFFSLCALHSFSSLLSFFFQCLGCLVCYCCSEGAVDIWESFSLLLRGVKRIHFQGREGNCIGLVGSLDCTTERAGERACLRTRVIVLVMQCQRYSKVCLLTLLSVLCSIVTCTMDCVCVRVRAFVFVEFWIRKH